MPSWTTMLILYFYQSLRKILNDFDNQNFFANFHSNVILKRKKIVLTLKSTGKMFSIMIPTVPISCRGKYNKNKAALLSLSLGTGTISYYLLYS